MNKILLDIEKEDLTDLDKLMGYVKDALDIHFKSIVPFIDEDSGMYDGKTRYWNKLTDDGKINLLPTPVSNNITATSAKAKYIVDTASALFIGVPPELSVLDTTNEDKKKVEDLNHKLFAYDLPKHLYNVGKRCSEYGYGFLLVYTREKDEFPRFISLSPRYTNVVYDCSIDPIPMFAFTLSEQNEMSGKTKNTYYKVWVYTDDKVYELRTQNSSNYTIQLLNSLSKEGNYEGMAHFFGKVPIEMFQNNEAMVGDARPVYNLINSYNDLQNNRLTNVQDILDYVLMLKNVDLGNEEERAAFKELLKEKILALKGDNTDAKFLANPLDQKQMQELLKSIENDIHQISGVPNFNSDTFSQNASGVALQMKLLGFTYLVEEKERNFSPSLMSVMDMIKNFMEKTTKANPYDIDFSKCKVSYTHNLPSNDQEMIAQITNLNNAGILDPQILRRLSFIGGNVDEYLANAKRYLEEKRMLEAKYKVVDNGNGKDNEGLNENNLEKQNEKPVDKTLQDNKSNANVGDSEKLSEDK